MTVTGFKLAVFDMDGVLTQRASSWEYVHTNLGVNNSGNLQLYREGKLSYIDFLKSDVQMWIDKLGSIKAEQIVAILDQVPLRNGIVTTVKSLETLGIKSVIVSGGIYWLAERISRTVDFTEIHANKIKVGPANTVIPDGIVMVDPKHKDLTIREIQNRLGVEAEETISIGDTSQDIGMFKNSGLSIAFNSTDDIAQNAADIALKGNNLELILAPISGKLLER